jgi:hypothetical protein
MPHDYDHSVWIVLHFGYFSTFHHSQLVNNGANTRLGR